ncbi:hypothetical protein N9D23_15260 [Rubripirellula sp.]|nr:hypothetical protein [Rubripirellula sp.]
MALFQWLKAGKTLFNAAILATFGKLNQSDIDEIDGRPERLIDELVGQYGLTIDEAQLRVDDFRSELSTQANSGKGDPVSGSCAPRNRFSYKLPA